MKTPKLKAGDWVEVRSKEEILRTLDSKGQLDGMPFMPEMFAFCGQRFRVYKRAHKTCDTVFPIRSRRVHRAVHLETRCDGHAHGGCQAGCLIFWKEVWLKRVDGLGTCVADSLIGISGTTETSVRAHAQITGENGGKASYVCQATQLPYATESLEWWDIRQYLEDYWSGNAGLWRMICGLVYSIYYSLSETRLRVGPAMRRFYDVFHPLWGGTLFPRKQGDIPKGCPTPNGALNLRAGELVRVKSHVEILRTVNADGRNRGMYWDAEMVPYCGKTYRVLKRVSRIINERTGEMQEMKNPCIILDSVVCQARYSHCRMFCPRSIYPYWREIWLERVEQAIATPESDNRECVAASSDRRVEGLSEQSHAAHTQ